MAKKTDLIPATTDRPLAWTAHGGQGHITSLGLQGRKPCFMIRLYKSQQFEEKMERYFQRSREIG